MPHSLQATADDPDGAEFLLVRALLTCRFSSVAVPIIARAREKQINLTEWPRCSTTAHSAKIRRSWCELTLISSQHVLALTSMPSIAPCVRACVSGSGSQLTDWLAHVPKEVLAKNFKVNMSAFDHIPSRQLYIFPSGGCSIPPPSATRT